MTVRYKDDEEELFKTVRYLRLPQEDKYYILLNTYQDLVETILK